MDSYSFHTFLIYINWNINFNSTYIQNPDCTEDEDAEFQKLTISTRSNGIDKFLNIKADNWSIDNTEGLVKIIEDFKTRIGYE